MRPFIVALLLASPAALAGDVTLYNPDGEPFFATLNGLRVTPQATARVTIPDLVDPSYKVRITFADETLGSFDKNLYVEADKDAVIAVRRNSRGAWVLRMESATARATTTAPPTITEAVDVSMSVNVAGSTVGASAPTTSVTVTTRAPAAVPAAPAPCSPMARSELDTAKAAIAAKSFSDSRLTMAKQLSRDNCLTSAQITEVVKLFDFESDRLEYAKLAYGYVADPGNYLKVHDAFDFESSIEELGEYIARQ